MAGESPFSVEDKVARPATPRGFSLAALFLLVTTAAWFRRWLAVLGTPRPRGPSCRSMPPSGSCWEVVLDCGPASTTRAGLPASMIGLAVGAVTRGICAAVAAAGTNGWLFVGGSAGIIALGLLARRGHTTE
jgi:hypothetical protein